MLRISSTNKFLRPFIVYLLVMLLFLMVLLPLKTAFAANITSPLNWKVLESDKELQGYSFLIAGHIYGEPENMRSVYSSASFLANIDGINRSDAKFLILLGDNYRMAEPVRIKYFIETICDKVRIPIFNAPGNHDLSDRELYVKHFGKTYYYMVLGSEAFIFLDTEIAGGEIVGEQLAFLKNTLAKMRKLDRIKNVFIFSHKLIWTVDNDALRPVYEHLNTPDGYPDGRNFKEIVLPEILKTATDKNVYWVSGDIGCSWSFPLFYGEHPDEKNLKYIGCGLGNTERDAMIEVVVDRNGNVKFNPVSLTGQELGQLSGFNVGYWSRHFSSIGDNRISSNNSSLTQALYMKATKLLISKHFYAGVFAGILLVGFSLLVARRWFK